MANGAAIAAALQRIPRKPFIQCFSHQVSFKHLQQFCYQHGASNDLGHSQYGAYIVMNPGPEGAVFTGEGLSFRFREKLPFFYTNTILQILAGQSIAIMGPSGSGKSTLAKLLLGLYHPSEGAIKIDGIDTRNLSANGLRSYFGVVPQETILFSGSILSNLQAGNLAASFEQITRAAKMAGIHDVIEKLPSGYQTEIGERGVGLSGGQKQRLAIARALPKRPKVLIFDEATSALDSETAEDFANTVNQLKGEVTMLFITHALPKNLLIDEVLRIHSTGITLSTSRREMARL